MDAAKAGVERDDVALLTGSDAGEVLAAALAVEGAHLTDWRVHSVHHRPGAGVSVGYTVKLGEDDANHYLCATTSRVSAAPGPGLVRLDNGERVIHVWRHPGDPTLPALADACTPAGLARRLELQGAPSIDLISYRPLRRAVVRARSSELPDGEVYVKVVQPSTAAEFTARHDMLTGAGIPAPRCLHSSDDGLVVLSSGRGVSLATRLAEGLDDDESGAVIDNIVAMLDAIPPAAMELPRRPAWSERASHYAHAASVVLPQHAARIERVARAVTHGLTTTDPGPVVPTHGDLYEANLLMAGTDIATMLDVDSLGPGHRVDDLACLLAHMSVLPCLAASSYPHVPAMLPLWTKLCDAHVDPAALRIRCAGVVLSLIAGARSQTRQDWLADAECRLAQAEAWLEA